MQRHLVSILLVLPELRHPVFSWYCPNCGTQLIGFKNAEGMIKVECKRCLAVSVRKVMGRRHNRIDIYAPKGQETVKI